VDAVRPGWRPRPAIILSMSLHAAALAALFAWPGGWGWALAAVAANHAVLLLAMLVPGAQSIGRSMNRLPPSQAAGRVALTFDDGPDPDVTPLVLDLLDRHGARATFFCIGQRATAQPALMREIRARGHGIGNHTMHHPLWFALLGIGGQRRELAAAEAALLQTGATNGLVRAPLGIRNPLSDWVFHRLGLQHVGWARRGFDTLSGDATRVVARITRGLREGDIILLHDGNVARDAFGRPVTLAVLEALLPALAARGLRSVNLSRDAALAATAAAAAAAGSRA
jgi:peptidoglycan/xylan/chitin deacetylase (PgdA/CDA1 family)